LTACLRSFSVASPGNEILPGQYFDAETGLHQNVMRDYDPEVGRYLQPDPLGIRGQMEVAAMINADEESPGSSPPELNLYSYAYSNPLKWVDPSGEVPRLHFPTPKFKRPPKVSGRYACNARCPTMPAVCPAPECPVVQGYGDDSSLPEAIRKAKSDANSKVPTGCQAKHCTYKCTGPRGDPIYPSN
jgi:RHS repeat-associated protein